MMSLDVIKKLSRQAGRRAAELNLEPLVAFTDKDENVKGCPNLGSYRPKGWKLVRKLFVSGSGFDTSGGPALTVNEFVAGIKAGYGYAIVEEGQFQLYIGEFRKNG